MTQDQSEICVNTVYLIQLFLCTLLSIHPKRWYEQLSGRRLYWEGLEPGPMKQLRMINITPWRNVAIAYIIVHLAERKFSLRCFHSQQQARYGTKFGGKIVVETRINTNRAAYYT